MNSQPVLSREEARQIEMCLDQFAPTLAALWRKRTASLDSGAVERQKVLNEVMIAVSEAEELLREAVDFLSEYHGGSHPDCTACGFMDRAQAHLSAKPAPSEGDENEFSR